MTKMKKWYLLMFISFLFLFSTVSAVTLDSGTVLNTTATNSSMNFTITAYADLVNVTPTIIHIINVSYIHGNLIVNATPSHDLNWSTNNFNLDSFLYPKIESHNDTNLNISSHLNNSLNATIEFNISIACSRFVNLTYTTVSGTESFFNATDSVCASSVITLSDGIIIEVNTTEHNTIEIIYTAPSTVIQQLITSPCDVLDFRCMIVNEIVGGAILASLLAFIMYLIVGWKMRIGFDAIIAFSIPFLLMIGLMFAGFSVMFAFATFAVGIMVAWAFNKMIKN